MPFDKTVLASLGGTEPHNGEFRSHLQVRDEKGTKRHICASCRATEEEAEKDLRQIRAAGAVGSTREESLKIMMAETRRIKMAVEYQNQYNKPSSEWLLSQPPASKQPDNQPMACQPASFQPGQLY